ncbi:MAG TPA: DUF4129 domain-containing protein [Syntrophorhabdaceae bacterium]|nr:DUF4129 domain-containing protein [Syntrophorhabdaceae bacterium]
MKKQATVALALTSGGMEICWLYSWAIFSVTACMHQPFPILGALLAFVGAAMLTRISQGKGWRVIYVGGLQVLGFLCVSLLVIHDIYEQTRPLFSSGWCVAFIHMARDPLEWLVLFLVIFWILAFWVGGITFCRRPMSYYDLCYRFDAGLAAFFGLSILKLLLGTKGGVVIEDRTSLALIFPFFLFSLMAVGMAKDENGETTDFLPGYRGVGTMAGFIAAIFLSAGSLALFFVPVLKGAATVGYRALHTGARWMVPGIETVLRFVFGARNVRPEPAGSSLKGMVADRLLGSDTWWMRLLDKILAWGIRGLAVALLVFLCAMLIYYLVKWLFSRTSYGLKKMRATGENIPWYVRLWRIVIFLYRSILQRVRGYDRASEVFQALLRWADHSGIHRGIQETPLEFGSRLNGYFPDLAAQVNLIVGAFNKEAYGDATVCPEYFGPVRSALISLVHPRHWPARCKTRFFARDLKQNL